MKIMENIIKNPQNTNKAEQEEWSPQRVALLSSNRNIYNNLKLNTGKTLITISAGGIGLLIGISNFLSFSSIWQIIFL